MNWGEVAAALPVGVVVGLTGMGGGAVMTPLLIVAFGVSPATAVSSDLLASLVMKPVGGGVHLHRGTVSWPLVGWLSLGAVPAAFGGVLVLRALGTPAQLSGEVQSAVGWALLAAVAALLAKAAVTRRRGEPSPDRHRPITVKPLPTLGVGLLGGCMVGMTSVGSGSLMMVMLLILYPALSSKRLVGTDLVQSIPLVGAATLGHALFDHIDVGLAATLLVGGLPGVYLGARFSNRAPDAIVRPVLILVLLVSALKLLKLPNIDLLWATFAAVAGAAWLYGRHRFRVPLTASSVPIAAVAAALGESQELVREFQPVKGRVS